MAELISPVYLCPNRDMEIVIQEIQEPTFVKKDAVVIPEMYVDFSHVLVLQPLNERWRLLHPFPILLHNIGLLVHSYSTMGSYKVFGILELPLLDLDQERPSPL
jgi:hypothetical protein